MQDNVSFWRLPSGRLLALCCGVAFIDLPAAQMLIAGGNEAALGITSLVLMACIAGSIFAAGLAVYEKPGAAAYVAMVCPVLLFAFYAIYGFASAWSPSLLMPFYAIGAGAVLMSFRPGVKAT